MKYSKLIGSIFLSTLVLYNTLNVSFIYIYYNVDPIGFIEKLCENKDKPELACNGKCHLKKVTKTTNTENNLLLNLIDFKDILLYKNTIDECCFSIVKKEKEKNYHHLNQYFYLDANRIFHPPQVSFLLTL